MKWRTCLAVFFIGTMVLQAEAVAANRSAGNFYALVTRINKTSATHLQSKYSSQLRKSINAAAVRHLEQTCAGKHSGAHVGTFTLLGTMRLDGVFKAPTPLPENDFTQCVASKLNLMTFPLPPGSGSGWPVAMQIDATTGKVLYVAGDKQRALYGQIYATTSKRWMYTPVPVVPAELHKSCKLSVWVSVGETGRVEKVEMGDSSCPQTMNKAAENAAGQWLYMGATNAPKVDPMDVRISFSIKNERVHVKL